MRHTTPYWRLSSFYFFYFASLGALIPYWGLYLKAHHFSSLQIGFLVGILPATKIISPFIWGWVSDHTQRPIFIVRLISVLTLFSFMLIFFKQDFLWLAIIIFIFSFFWNASLPLFEVITLNHLAKNPHNYSLIRLWGSLGFILFVLLIGKLLLTYSVQIIPYAVMASFIFIALASFIVPEKKVAIALDTTSIIKCIKQPKVRALLMVGFLMLVSHGPYYSFYTIYLQTQGYSADLIGLLWAVGVIAEVIVFLLMHQIMSKFGAQKLLLISLLFTSLRWILIANYIDNLNILFIAQLLHAFSFGLFHSVCINLVHQYFTGKHQARGQALYASVSFGAGVAIGSIISGLAWDSWGGDWLFILASCCTLLAMIIVYKYIPNLK